MRIISEMFLLPIKIKLQEKGAEDMAVDTLESCLCHNSCKEGNIPNKEPSLNKNLLYCRRAKKLPKSSQILSNNILLTSTQKKKKIHVDI